MDGFPPQMRAPVPAGAGMMMKYAAAVLLFACGAAFAQRIDWKPMNEPGVGGALTAIAVSPHNPDRVLAAGDMLGAAFSEDRGETWQVTTGFVSWELGEFTFHPSNPDEVWVGTMSGPHVSRDGGRTWELKREGFPPVNGGMYSAPVQKIVFDRENPQRLLAFGGSHRRWESPGRPQWGAVWESADGGETWSRLATVGEGKNITSAVAGTTALYVSTYGEGVWRSSDGGASWSACGPGMPHGLVYQIALHPEDPNILWAALDNRRDGSNLTVGGVYKSVDGCATWTDSSQGLPRRLNSDVNQMSRFKAIAVAPTDPNRLYTSDMAWSTASIWRSDDGGATWQSLLNYGNRGRWPLPFGNGPTAEWIAVHPAAPDVVYFANQANIVRTMDGGREFEDMGSSLVSAERKEWTGRGFSGLVSVNFRFNPVRPGHAVFNAMDDGKVWMSEDDLKTWWYAGPGVPAYEGGNDTSFSGPDGNILYTGFGQFGGFHGLARSADFGRTWTMLWGADRGLPARGAANSQPRGIYALPDDPNRAWAVIGAKLYATGDGGAKWEVVLEEPGLAWIAGKGLTLYVSGRNGIYRSEDGKAFSLMEGSPRETGRLTLDPADPDTLYATKWRKQDGGLWRWRGGAWTHLHTDAFIYDVDVDPRNRDRIVACTNDDPYHDVSFAKGVYLSEDGGVTWSRENTGLAMLRAAVVRFDPHVEGRLVLGTGGRGYFVGNLRPPEPVE